MANSAPRIEIGRDIRAHCTKCKAETVHVITKIEAGRVRKVFCKACNSTHLFKSSDDVRRSLARSSGSKSTGAARTRRKNDWATLLSGIDDNQIVEYDITKDFSSIEAIRHKTFGVGVITKVLDYKKIEVVFQDEKKVLAQNWS